MKIIIIIDIIILIIIFMISFLIQEILNQKVKNLLTNTKILTIKIMIYFSFQEIATVDISRIVSI